VTLKPGLGSLKVIENYTSGSATNDFLLTFHSHHRPLSYRLRDKRQYPSKIANFSDPRVLSSPMKRFHLEFDIGVRGFKCLNGGATRWSKTF